MKKIVVFLAVLFFALAITFGIKAVKNADGRTNGTSVAWNEEIETFACSISKNSQTDREKVKAVYDSSGQSETSKPVEEVLIQKIEILPYKK